MAADPYHALDPQTRREAWLLYVRCVLQGGLDRETRRLFKQSLGLDGNDATAPLAR